MSSELEFDRFVLAIRAPTGNEPENHPLHGWPAFDGWGHDGNLYLAFAHVGCSNVFDYQNRIAKDWHFAYGGSAYQLIRQVATVAADAVLSGSVCLRSRANWTKPETYIAAYRKAMEDATPFERVASSWRNDTLKLRIDEEAMARAADHPRTAEVRGRIAADGTFTTAKLGSPDGYRDMAYLASIQADTSRSMSTCGRSVLEHIRACWPKAA